MNPIFSFRFQHELGFKQTDVLVLFNSVRELDAATIASEVEREIDANLVPDEILILVRELSVEASKAMFASDSTLETMRGRVVGRSRVTLVGYDEGGRSVSRTQVFNEGPAFGLPFDAFKRRALTSICREHGAFVEATPAYHFENPSKRHTEHFIRLSNILVRSAEIAFVAFCALPYIAPSVRVAYLDTPSLYAVVSSINEQICSLNPTRPAIVADNFRSYMGLKNYKFRRIGEAVVLVSASSSGGLARELIDYAGFTLNQIVHVLSLAEDKNGLQIVCGLQRDLKLNPHGYLYTQSEHKAGKCKLCDSGSKAIKLQGDQFDIAGPQPEPLVVNRDDQPKTLEATLLRFVGHSVFAVGLGRTQTSLPRQFHINADTLYVAPKFSERLDYVLKANVPARIGSVVCLDPASRTLANRVVAIATQNGRVAPIIERDKLDDIRQQPEDPVVIVAATIESGRSLLDVSRDLRNICPKAPLLYLVGVDKSTGEERREALPKTLVQCDAPVKHAFVAVDHLILPGSFDANSWHLELSFLQDPVLRQFIKPRLVRRIDQRVALLRQTSALLSNNLFWSVDVGRELKLQRGFAFWPASLVEGPHSQADVYFTVASVLQQLRANAAKPHMRCLKSNWFQQSLIAPSNFGRFNDGIIQASILRSALPSEMNYAMAPEVSREMARIIHRIIVSATRPRGESAVEFLLAIATRRMTLTRSDTVGLKKNAAGTPQIIRMMIDAAIEFTV